MLKKYFESWNLTIFEEVVHNFGFSEKVKKCLSPIDGLMPNLINKSLAVSKLAPWKLKMVNKLSPEQFISKCTILCTLSDHHRPKELWTVHIDLFFILSAYSN